jgi:hypothetical protein
MTVDHEAPEPGPPLRELCRHRIRLSPHWTIVVREPVRSLVALGVFVDGALLDGLDEVAGESEVRCDQRSFRATSSFSYALRRRVKLTSPPRAQRAARALSHRTRRNSAMELDQPILAVTSAT